jgi:FAD/FMN-containing dehydrogenase/Fe-S oxidoreductase
MTQAINDSVRALRTDLRSAVAGEVRFTPGDRALYAYDASIFRQVPIGAVIPRTEDDVLAALAVCRDHRVPVFGRGCGTGLAGQTVNAAVVIDFSKHLNAIRWLNPQARQARVQPGVICDELRDAAEEYGLTFGPDPATHDHATLGGMIGNNSCGTHSVMAGKTVDNIDELDVVCYDGTRLRVGATTEPELEQIIAAGGRRGEIYAGMKRIRDTYADVIRSGLPDIPRRVSGYNLDQLLPENSFHVARALVGTESTCALTLAATCKLVWSPPERSLVVLGYPDIPSSGDDVAWLLGFEPIALEFFSQEVLDHLHAKGRHFGGDKRLPDGVCWLLVEFGAETKREADDQAERLFAALRRRQKAPAYKLIEDPHEESQIWSAREHGVGSGRLPLALGGHEGWPNWEDAAVPPERMGQYLRDFDKLLDEHGYDGVMFGHWGHGCIHCRIDFDLRHGKGIKEYRRFMEHAADLVVAYGGSLSGEHGDGHGRAELWPKMFPPDLMRAFDEFKAVWDPDNMLNPHKLVPDPYPLDSHLREGAGFKHRRVQTVFSFPDDGGKFGEAVDRCFGVGACRHLDGDVMCPSFMVTREEKHSTRGRARLLQEMMRSDGAIRDRWRSSDVKESLDLCLACKGCRGDCPVRVDMATYKAEFLHHHYRRRLRPRQAYALGLIDKWARAASRLPRLANAMAGSPVAKSIAGIAPDRAVPRFASQTFREWFERSTPRFPDGPRVLLWPDTFTNYLAPEIGRDAVTVLEAAGYRVLIPAERKLCCGRPLYDYGMLTLARRYLRRVVRSLTPLLREGVPVVGLEPSCLAVFRDELGNLFPDDADAQRLRDQSFVLSEFLQRGDWPLPRLERSALVQPHCHHHAVMGFDAELEVLRGMGIDVEPANAGCCGMAGSFGYEAGERFEVSIAAGERTLLPKVRAARPDTLVLADGFSCRSQIADGTERTGLHLAQVLAMAIEEGQAGRTVS